MDKHADFVQHLRQVFLQELSEHLAQLEFYLLQLATLQQADYPAAESQLLLLLEQDDIRLFGADHPRHFVEAEGHVFRRGRIVGACGQVIPEHVALARQVLHVPGHHLECLTGLQLGDLATA